MCTLHSVQGVPSRRRCSARDCVGGRCQRVLSPRHQHRHSLRAPLPFAPPRNERDTAHRPALLPAAPIPAASPAHTLKPPMATPATGSITYQRRIQAAKLNPKDTVLAEPVPIESLPAASLIVLQVTRLRPKGAEELRLETTELCGWFDYLQGVRGAAPGQSPVRWPASVGYDFYLVQSPLVLSCKVRPFSSAGTHPPLLASFGRPRVPWQMPQDTQRSVCLWCGARGGLPAFVDTADSQCCACTAQPARECEKESKRVCAGDCNHSRRGPELQCRPAHA